MIDKRSILKGAIGAAVLASRKNSNMKPRPPLPHPSNGQGHTQEHRSPDPIINPPTLDPMAAIRRHMLQRADEERERLVRDIDNMTQRLFELQSLSPAYRRFRIMKLEQERRAVHQRYYQLANNL